MYEVDGYIDGVLYTARVGGDQLGTQSFGLVSGSPSIIVFMYQHRDDIAGTAPGPSYRVDENDPVSILAAFQTWTEVIAIRGDIPIDPDLPDRALNAIH